MADVNIPSFSFESGPPNFSRGYVPPLGPEDINLRTATEEREIIQASIKHVQAEKQVRLLNEQFALDAEGEA